MSTDTQLRPTDGQALRRSTTTEQQDCRGVDGLRQRSEAVTGRHLSLVPPLVSPSVLPSGDRRSRMYRELMTIDPSGGAAGMDQQVRSRAARRTAARRARVGRRAGIRMERWELHREAGMATAEYAIATLAAVGFAALLVAVLSSGQVKGLLTSLITTALKFG